MILMSNFREMCSVGAALIQADRRTDKRTTDGRKTDGRKTDMMDVKHTFRNYVNSPKIYLM
jgi:hypothetical protein